MKQAQFVGNLLKQLQGETADKLNISKSTLADILNNKITVDHIVYRNQPKIKPRVSRAVMALIKTTVVAMLILCLFVPGFADSIRATILFSRSDTVATSVKLVSYDKYYSTDETVLPQYLVDGFEYTSHKSLRDMSLMYVLFTDQQGQTIEYYYYPDGVQAGYDNEFSEYHTIAIKGGEACVGYTDESTTTMYFMHYEAYIEIEFSFRVDDKVLRSIADSVREIEN